MYCKKDAIYARQSVDKQDSISIENQIDYCMKEVRNKESNTYIDRGYSGKNTQRPQFEKMIEDIRAGRISRVITYKLDRVSRSVLDFQKLIVILEEFNVEFFSVTERFDTASPVGRAMRNIMSVFAQLERETIQQRITDAYYSLSKKGMYMGGRVPFGYRLESIIMDGRKTSKYVECKEEAEQLIIMYTMYAEPLATLGGVKRYLNEKYGMDSKGRLWTTPRMSEVMRSPIYVKADAEVYHFFLSQGTKIINDIDDFVGINGCYLYKGRDNDTRKQIDLKDRELVVAPHKGIIQSDIWIQCRYKLLANKQCTSGSNVKNSWLAGKTKCGNCGYAATVRKSKTKHGRYFVCSGMSPKIKCSGLGETVYGDLLESYMLNAVKEKLNEFNVLTGDEEPEAIANNRINENKIKISKIDTQINSLIDKVQMANESVMLYINKKVDELNEQKKEIIQENVMLNSTGKKNNVQLITDHVAKWERLSFEDKRKVVDVLIEMIYLSNGRVEIVWRI